MEVRFAPNTIQNNYNLSQLQSQELNKYKHLYKFYFCRLFLFFMSKNTLIMSKSFGMVFFAKQKRSIDNAYSFDITK